MKNILMTILGVLYLFIIIWLPVFILMLIIFIPVLPILFLAFPMLFTDKTHWSCKPYLWYFNNVWLNVLKLIKI